MYLSGDNFCSISNILITTKKYFKNYIKPYYIPKNIIYIEHKINKEIFNYKNIIFFTKIECLQFFTKNILPNIKENFILITHNSDKNSGYNNLILNNPYLIKWYGQNMDVNDIKTQGIPIGLENKCWNNTNFLTIQNNINKVKNKLLYINFSTKSNKKRSILLKNLLNKGFKKNNKLPWELYISDLSNYKFAISPAGNGVDCHRTWECLYLNVIPIILKSNQMNYFNNLPILFVNTFDDITPEYLEKAYYSFFKNKIFNTNMLHIDFWERKMIQDFKMS